MTVSMWMRQTPAIDRMRHLRTVWGSTGAELAQIDRLTYELEAPAGAVVISEGQSPQGFFLIVSGRALVSVAGVDCEVLEPGMFFGEAATIDRGPEPATVAALTDLVVRVATRREFDELTKIGFIARALVRTLATNRRLVLQARPLPARPAGEGLHRTALAQPQ
jgi:CRP-like cAMP-binding protein